MMPATAIAPVMARTILIISQASRPRFIESTEETLPPSIGIAYRDRQKTWGRTGAGVDQNQLRTAAKLR
jgi:hypothetical protein